MDPTDTAPIPAESVGLSGIVRSTAADIADAAMEATAVGHERSTRPAAAHDVKPEKVVAVVQKSSKRASRINKMRDSHERRSSSRRRAAVDVIRKRKIDSTEFLDSIIAETQRQQLILYELRSLGASLLKKATLTKPEALKVVSVMSSVSDKSTSANMMERAMSISSDRLTNLTLGADTAISQISGSIQDSNTSERTRATAAMLAIAASDRASTVAAKGARGKGGSGTTPIRAVLEAVDAGEHLLGFRYLSAPGIPMCTSSFTGRALQVSRAAMFSRARRKETLHFKRMDSRVKRREGGLERRRLASVKRERAAADAASEITQTEALPPVPTVATRKTKVKVTRPKSASVQRKPAVLPIKGPVEGMGSSNMPSLG